ncbi:hypothetical protein NBRC116188_19720 [Oceaniserpentilla sp. 4NH20-0058]|uniref:HEPN domain-containing protein n=1 Tax=Oceaniserpentilla sp. 4NH20-0058 TaxID=3127660 RepID=UPI00310582A1
MLNFDFATTVNESTKCKIDGKTIHGELHLSPTNAARVTLKESLSLNLLEHSMWSCGSTWLSFFHADVYGTEVYPRYILSGKTDSTHFKGFNVRFELSSQWFDGGRKFEQAKDDLILKARKSCFNTNIKSIQEPFRIYTQYRYKTKQGETHDVTEIDSFHIISVEYQEPQSLDHIHSHANELLTLMSILMGQPEAIRFIEVLSDKTSFRLYPNFYYQQAPLDLTRMDFLLAEGSLKNGKHWSNVLNGFFSDENQKTRKEHWARLATSLRSEGYWDMEISNVISLLDELSDRKRKTYTNKLQSSSFKALKSELLKSVNTFFNNPTLQDHALRPIVEEYINSMKNTSVPTFKDRLNELIKSIPEKIFSIFDLNKDDLNHIINIRNKVFHGQNPEPKEKLFITQEVIIKNKLLLLLLYLAHKDLGISDNDFIDLSYPLWHPIARGADINKVALDRIAGRTPFIPVSDENFSNLKEVNSIYSKVLTYDAKQESFQLEIKLTDNLKNKERGKASKYPDDLDYLASILEFNYSRIMYYSSAYFENQGCTHQLHSVIIIDPPALIAKLSSRELQLKTEEIEE